MWLLLIWSCGSDDALQDVAFDSAVPIPSQRDTGPAEAATYDPAAHWVSHAEGYATGGAFADVDGDGLIDLVVSHGIPS